VILTDDRLRVMVACAMGHLRMNFGPQGIQRGWFIGDKNVSAVADYLYIGLMIDIDLAMDQVNGRFLCTLTTKGMAMLGEEE
jgi:hypothetical protein